jgi:hypothetical protein
MPRRSEQTSPEVLRARLVQLLSNFETELRSDDLRSKVLSLIPAFHGLRDLGSSLVTGAEVSSARDRILCYLTKYPYTVIQGDELMVVSGIGEWARRVRELRVQFGWPIVSGVTAREMGDQEDLLLEGVDIGALAPDEYILLGETNDREAAHRWHSANEIRKSGLGVRKKLIEFLRRNVGSPVTGEELRYVANNRTEWARRVRELRTEHGWPVVTKSTGRPDLPVGTYLLEQDRQSPQHDRNIPDPLRRAVLVRDRHRCTKCGWSHSQWNPSDPRHLELHHMVHHVDGGPNVESNLTTLCTVCHDEVHSKEDR